MWPRWGLVAMQLLQDPQEWGPPKSSEKGVWLEPRSRGRECGEGQAQFRCLYQAVSTDLREGQQTCLAL